jgi:uncharacterized protein (TIGR03437 family)
VLRRNGIAILALVCAGVSAQTVRRNLAIDQTRYTVVAGGRVRIPAPAESLAFVKAAATRAARASGRLIRDFALGPNVEGDQILLGVPLTAAPGEYSVEVSIANASGEERVATLLVTVLPFAVPAASSAGEPPVVLLDGFQFSLTSSCPMSSNSSGTFGNLQTYLEGSPNNVPAVYFFENCTECPNCTIEQLGADLGDFLNSLAAPQVDVVAHSMGGLIVRTYLSGKQVTPGVFSPPATPKIRKAVFVATPHFGSFQADSGESAILFAVGNQDNEMKRGSQFLWDLGTWNQFGDDLRGVDAVSVVGNAGPSQESDGVVYSTSASLEFAVPGRTRVVGYCHIPPSSADGLAFLYTECTASGIADVDSTSHLTYQIISSFLLNTPAWQSVGNAPAQDAHLSQDGGLMVAEVDSSGQYATPGSVSWGNVKLTQGSSAELFYNDFVSGTGAFNFGTPTPCGPFTPAGAVYSAVRCKSSPSVSSVGPVVTGTGKVVQAGGTITITGNSFGAQQCPTCQVTAANPNSKSLAVTSWSDTGITALLPASYGGGIATIAVSTAGGSDAMNIMAGSATPLPVISLSSSSLTFSFSAGGAVPPATIVTVSNAGGGSLSYSVTSSAAWLLTSSSGDAITIAVDPSGLAANSYPGTVTVTAFGAMNSPQTIDVSLLVTGSVSNTTISSITNAATSVQGPLAPGELFTIKGNGLGPTPGVVFSVDPATGMVDGTLAGTQVMVGSVAAPILYSSATQVNAIVPYEMTGQPEVTVEVRYQGGAAAQAVQIQGGSPGAFTQNSTGSGQASALNQDYSINGPSNPAAKGSYVTVYWTGGGQTSPPGVTGSVTGSVLKWLTQPISAKVGNQAETVSFDGSAPTLVDGVNQLNIQLSPNTPSGAQPLVITVGGISSPSTGTISVQ